MGPSCVPTCVGGASKGVKLCEEVGNACNCGILDLVYDILLMILHAVVGRRPAAIWTGAFASRYLGERGGSGGQWLEC